MKSLISLQDHCAPSFRQKWIMFKRTRNQKKRNQYWWTCGGNEMNRFWVHGTQDSKASKIITWVIRIKNSKNRLKVEKSAHMMQENYYHSTDHSPNHGKYQPKCNSIKWRHAVIFSCPLCDYQVHLNTQGGIYQFFLNSASGYNRTNSRLPTHQNLCMTEHLNFLLSRVE